jgi:hypothetical protein
MVIFRHRREDMKVESRIQRIRSSTCREQINQSTGPSSLGEAFLIVSTLNMLV